MPVIERRRPGNLVEQGHALRKLTPHLAAVTDATCLGKYFVDLVELSLQLPFSLRRRLLRAVANRQRVDIRQCLPQGQRGNQQKQPASVLCMIFSPKSQAPSPVYCASEKPINSAFSPPPAATTRYCLPCSI